MIYRAKAPLRLGLAGGGTDVDPYCQMYGGNILNATVSLYAYAAIIPRDDGRIVVNCVDRNLRREFDASSAIDGGEGLQLQSGVYNRVVKQFAGKPLSFELSTFVDAPAGSGLGTSSTLVVAILGAFVEWLNLPLGEYDIAHLAYEIERIDLAMAGGKQDQYAATFGGFNFMEFYRDNKIIVNPLRIKDTYINELENNLILYYTGTSRLSSQIISAQAANVVAKKDRSIDAMHRLKEQAIEMKEAILRGKLQEIGRILDFGWQSKKKMADGISNPVIDEIYDAARKAGSSGGKITGAGGGGFMMFYCPANSRYDVFQTLQRFGGQVKRYQFIDNGMISWTSL